MTCRGARLLRWPRGTFKWFIIGGRRFAFARGADASVDGADGSNLAVRRHVMIPIEMFRVNVLTARKREFLDSTIVTVGAWV
jgi:hypothetical protein